MVDSTTSATTSTTASIVKTLGSGSGLDTSAIVDALVQAQYAAKNNALSKRADALTTQISGIAKLKSGLTGVDTALRTLVKSGSLTTQPTSSNAAVATVSGKATAALSGTLTVNRLAGAQAATTNTGISPTATFNAGSLDVTVGATTSSIALDGTETLAGVAAKINAANLGLTASIVSESDGSVRMTVKGATGAANAFTIAGADSDPAATGQSLSSLSVGNGATATTIGTTAQDAELVLDGATFHRATNKVTGLIAGITVQLTGTGTTTLGSSAPTAALTQAVTDLVDTLNQLHGVIVEQVDPKTGALRADPAARTLARSLTSLTTVSLAATADGSPRTLGDIGVLTNRDGTLSVDTARLTKALASYPAAVEAMFADGSGASNGGIAAALGAITTKATDRTYGFDAETSRYTSLKADVSSAQSQATDAATAMKDRLTQQFATMDARVAAYKSTQDFLKQQVDAWNKSD